MEDNKNYWIAPSIVALGLVLVAVAIALRPVGIPTVTVGGDTSNNPAPVIVSGTGQNQEPQFGAFGTNIDDETVFTRLKVESNLRVFGTINSTSVPQLLTLPFGGPTSTNSLPTVCTFTNPPTSTGGRPIVLKYADIQYATTTFGAGGNTLAMTIGISATVGATGTGQGLLTNTTLAFPTNGLTNITPTSTLVNATTTFAGNEMFGLPQVLMPGFSVNFNISPPTSSLSGVCHLERY